MRIAVLGWGSLIWDPRSLAISNGQWHPDGPSLPIEYARIASPGKPGERLTLAIRYGVPNVQVLWIESGLKTLERARRNLANREGTSPDKIGYATASESRMKSLTQAPPEVMVGTTHEARIAMTDKLVEALNTWREDHGLEAVIWTDLPSNFEDIRRDPSDQSVTLTPAAAVAYLREKIDYGLAEPAELYVRRTPYVIRTPVREEIELALGWVQSTITSITSADDIRFKEWSECRTAIGRLDGILVDLRKMGFGFITALLSAGAFVSLLGTPSASGAPVAPIQARAAVFIAIMLLVAALFWLDIYYEVLLAGAVQRALDLECQTDPPVRLSKYLSINARATAATWIILLVYLILLSVACGFGLLTVLATPNPTAVLADFAWGLGTATGLARLIGVLAAVLAAVMVIYWVVVAKKTRFHSLKRRRPWRLGEKALQKAARP